MATAGWHDGLQPDDLDLAAPTWVYERDEASGLVEVDHARAASNGHVPPARAEPRGPGDGPAVEHDSDAGNALRLVAAHGHEIRYVGQWGAWLAWDGKRWRRDHRGAVHEHAKDVVRSLWGDANTMPEGKARKRAAAWALTSEAAGRLEAMVRVARTDPRVALDADHLDANPWLLNVANGTIDLRTGDLRAHDPADHITKVAGCDYTPHATAPRFGAFLEQIQPDPDVRTFLQRAIGYSLTGLTTEQVLFFAHGAGANGKSTFSETCLAMLGDYGRQADPELLLIRDQQHPTGVADLMGARLVVSSEIEEGRRLAEATVKQLTGGDRIKARFMRQDFFEFTPTHKLFLHANHRPVVRGTDLAIWRRMRLVPFTVTIARSDQDPHLQDRLRAELAGVLNWALQGCADWQKDGLTEPLAVRLATSDYQAEMDILGAFLNEWTITTEGARVGATDLYDAYKRWCDDNGERPVSQTRLGRALTERGYNRTRGTAGRVIITGLGLLDTHHHDQPTDPTPPTLQYEE